VSVLPKPEVPDGPIRVLFDNLHDLHHQAGWPSLREIAKEVGCSHTTVSVAFSEPRVPRWGLLELIVEALGGDTDRFHRLWLAASTSQTEATADDPGSRAASLPPPRELPADVAGFTGRVDQLADLDRLLAPCDPMRTAVVISAVSGTAGVGKTALAVHWAHRVADRFPDGQLYINLRGYDPDRPVQQAEALSAMLRALGVPDGAVPQALAERSARYRSLLSGRRMLVLLDNAQSVDQVHDLLPGTPSCLVIVTSRDTLPALIARYGAVRLNLDLLSPDDAVRLLQTLIGHRVDAEPEEAAALAERCSRLPLALRIAAELAASRPAAPLADLVEELSDERRRLDLLAAGEDQRTAVRAVFSWSYRRLDADATRAFQLLGLHPGRDIDDYATAALIGCDLATAYRILGVLARAHLVEETRPGRFGMHDLLRAYAAERAAECAGPDRQAALTRLLDYYAYTATNATDAAFPNSRQRRLPVTLPATPTPHITDAADARDWLDSERQNLLSAAATAAAEGRASHTSRLAGALAPYLDARAHYEQALTLHGLAVETARACGDRAGEGVALNLLGSTYRRLGRYPEAIDRHQRARVIHHEISDRVGESEALHGLGILYWRMGRYREAGNHLERALTIHREVDDRVAEGRALYSLGIVHRRLGHLAVAVDDYRRSLAIQRATGDRTGEGRAVNNLAIVYLQLGHHAKALDNFQLSLAIQREIGDRTGEAVALTNLGLAYERLGRYDDALDHHRQAFAILRAAGYRVGQGEALRGLGVAYARLGRFNEALDHLRRAVSIGREIGEAEVHTGALNDLADTLRAVAQPEEAMTHYRSALVLASQTGDQYEEARAHNGMAHLLHDAGHLREGRVHWQQALIRYTDLGVPEAEEVHRRLGALLEQVVTA
jgi:tetratricopeptide (TPR) repeat protein